MLADDGVEVGDPLGALEALLEETLRGVPEAETVELTETTGLAEEAVAEVEPEIERVDASSALLEEVRIVAVLLGDTEMLVLDGAVPLVEALTPEVRTVIVVVTSTEAVPEMVPST